MLCKYRCLLILICALLGALVPPQQYALAQLRVVSYNTAQGPHTGIETVLEAIGDEIVNGFSKPIDVLALQEQTSWQTTTTDIVTELNSIYGAGTYDLIELNGDTGGAGRPGLVYNTTTVTPISQIAFGDQDPTAQARQTLRYQLRPVGYDSSADFYVYSNHYKAGSSSEDMGRRDIEAMALRANLDALGDGTHAILSGDYNIKSSTEYSYQILLAAGSGKAVDPINTPGTWSNVFSSNIKKSHTQSPATSSQFSGQVLFGMDDRFDFQLNTEEFQDGEGLSYITNSYHAFGNNGTHSNDGAITTGSGASATVLNAIMTASDHIPVVADYQIPASMLASLGTVPANVSQGSFVNFDVMVENIASVLAANGADELDYSISVSGALSGSAGGTDFALGGGNTHQLLLNTSTLGSQTGTVTVTTLSQGAANPLFNLPVSFTVGEGGGGGPVFGVIAKDDFDSTLNRISYSQSPAPGAFGSLADGFQVYQVGVSSSIPFAIVDDSADVFPADTQGIIDSNTKTDAWFGVADVVNGDNPSGMGVATWEFNIVGATGLEVSIDMGAMGDFDAASDVFDWTYSIDGGPEKSLFTSSVDSAGSAIYTLADGDQFNLNDPLEMTTSDSQTLELSNILQTLTSPLVGSGNTLVIELTAITNDDSGATARSYAFDNIIVEGFTGGSFLEADFNEDGNVDALDLAQWEGDYGLNDQSDADGDGDSDGDDLLFWQRQNGQSTLLTAASQAVPEPATALLLLLGLPWLSTRQKLSN